MVFVVVLVEELIFAVALNEELDSVVLEEELLERVLETVVKKFSVGSVTMI